MNERINSIQYQMDPVSLHSTIAGLSATLESILRTLPSSTTNLVSTKPGAVDTRADVLSRDLRQDWHNIQKSSRYADLKHAQVGKLLHSLQIIEYDLDKLHKVFGNVDTYRKIPLLRRFHWRHDSEDAMTSMLLAKNVIVMIRTLQGLGNRETLLIESVG